MRVDDSLDVIEHQHIGLDIPKRIRRMCRHRRDVILALLTEDPEYIRRVRPYITILGRQINVAHLVVKPELAELIAHVLADYDVPHFDQRLDALRADIRHISFVDGDRTNLIKENLRAIFEKSSWDTSTTSSLSPRT
jgi:hypothetical protein